MKKGLKKLYDIIFQKLFLWSNQPDMKKINSGLIIAIMILGSFIYFLCSSNTTAPQKNQFPCGVPPHRLSYGVIAPLHEAVFNPPYKWNKKELKVFFTDINNYSLMQKTLETANTWGNGNKLKFKLESNIFDSDIRVSFREPNGYLSYIGKEAANPAFIGKATMWLQDLDMQEDDEFRRVVLHEFGHAIGLEHELQSVNARINWDTAAVYTFYDTAYGWSVQKVNHNVFTPINTGAASRFDPRSIMIYAVPAFLTKDRTAIAWPYDLSEEDKKMINKFYR